MSRSSLRMFLSESVRSWPRTASLFPSSSALAASLVRSVDFASARTIVELGVGTGAITSVILRCMERNARVYAIDINPVFIAHVKQRFRDPRLIPILGDARHMEALFQSLNITRADAVISSLSLTWMEDHTRSAVLSQITRSLSDHAVFTQYQYLHASAIPPWCSRLGISTFDGKTYLRRYFQAVSTETVLWNLPPAVVYTCRLESELRLAR
jgi:phosphatidylethanolamine/phosphatidyl-N-methylethanolamine N-methyltransferase